MLKDLWVIVRTGASLIGLALAIAWLLHAAGIKIAGQRCEERLSRIEAKLDK